MDVTTIVTKDDAIREALIKATATQLVFEFPNGFGASVIRNSFSYGGDQGLFELAVLRFEGGNYSIAYDTPITSNVLGYLSAEDVRATLDRIKRLPKNPYILRAMTACRDWNNDLRWRWERFVRSLRNAKKELMTKLEAMMKR